MSASTRFVIVLCVALLNWGCSAEPPPPAPDATEVDAQADGQGSADTLDLADATSETQASGKPVDPFACPGGHRCACSDNAECLSGLCLDLGQGKRCAEPCDKGACDPGQACKSFGEGEDQGWFCAPAFVGQCNPCKSSSECGGPGLEDAACVSYGNKGSFCGVSCRGDADCDVGYSCKMMQRIEGRPDLQCVKVDNLGLLTDCPCSEAAVNAQLETNCGVSDSLGHTCPGTRYCTAQGLTECSAESPKAELCDGADNDCDGATDEDACVDGNPCTDDSCDIGLGCINSQNTSPCDADGSVCTVGDTCDLGVCVAGSPLSCDDANPCTTDSCNASSGCQNAPIDGGTCDADGEPCTVGDSCVQGSCVAGKIKNCGDSDACTLDSCDDKGGCVNTVTNGLSCDDGNPCTTTDLCDGAGACKGSTLKCDDGNPCTEDSCDPAIGCNTTAVPDGASCDDGDLCTVDGTCLNAQCTPGKGITCQSNKVCVQSLCEGSTGKCVESQAKVGTLCDDGDPCSLGDNCNSIGDCVAKSTGCNDANPCTQDACSSQGCTYQKLTGPCDDNDACTINESCQELNGVASCESTSIKDCDDKNPCTQDTCEPAKGCVTTALQDGQSCDDGDKCTADDTCQAGQCTGGKDTCSCTQDSDCDDKNPCTTDACGNDSKCAATPLQDGASCDDGDKCTEAGACKSAGAQSTCSKGPKKDCDDKNPCTTDSCDASKGCLNNAKADGDSCDDGDKCTESDGCTAGKCIGVPPKSEVSTLAGKGQGFKNDKGTNAQFNVPSGVVRDTSGNLFVADTTNHQIRKIDSAGNVTTFAGSPLAGQINGTGQNASFNGPRGLTIDDQNNLYVADTGNHLVRKITPAGAVTTVAGSNTPGGFGQPLQGGFAEGKGTAAKFNGLSALTWSAGVLYVADTNNHRIRTVAVDGTVSTFAGNATPGSTDGKGSAAQLNLPAGVTVSSAGLVYVGDTGNHRVRVIQKDGTVSTLAGSTSGQKDGQGVAAQFKDPMGLTFDGLGHLLVCDSGNHMVRSVKISGEVTTYVGTGTSGFTDGALASTQFNQPSAIVSDAKGKAWIADRGNHRIRAINDAAKTCAIGANGP